MADVQWVAGVEAGTTVGIAGITKLGLAEYPRDSIRDYWGPETTPIAGSSQWVRADQFCPEDSR